MFKLLGMDYTWSMDISDEQLVGQFLKGNEKALESLLDRYLKPLYGFVFQFVRDENVAQDLTQETFVKAWKNLSKFDSKKKFSTWIFAIAKNTAFDWLKKKKALPFSFFETEQGNEILENLEDQVALCAQELWQKMDNAQAAQALLASLSPGLQAILRLHLQEGFSLTEIAEILKKPANTIKSQYRRALAFLRVKDI